MQHAADESDEKEGRGGHSVTAPTGGSTRASKNENPAPPCHIVLYQPQIPWNTGNIGRTCAALGAKLWIVEPANFRLDERSIRRAGLDYWQHVDCELVPDWQTLQQRLAKRRFWYLSSHARRSFWDVVFAPEDVFVFGNETSGLPPEILQPEANEALTVPMTGPVRCLNLSTTAGVVAYEAVRQMHAAGMRAH